MPGGPHWRSGGHRAADWSTLVCTIRRRWAAGRGRCVGALGGDGVVERAAKAAKVSRDLALGTPTSTRHRAPGTCSRVSLRALPRYTFLVLAISMPSGVAPRITWMSPAGGILIPLRTHHHGVTHGRAAHHPLNGSSTRRERPVQRRCGMPEYKSALRGWVASTV